MDDCKRLITQGRCVKCKLSTSETAVTCTGCLEYRYCSHDCLEADKENHVLDCYTVGMQTKLSLNDRSEKERHSVELDKLLQGGSGEDFKHRASQKKSKKKKGKNKCATEKVTDVVSGDFLSTPAFKKGYFNICCDIHEEEEEEENSIDPRCLMYDELASYLTRAGNGTKDGDDHRGADSSRKKNAGHRNADISKKESAGDRNADSSKKESAGGQSQDLGQPNGKKCHSCGKKSSELKMCGRCQKAHYCNRTCQVRDYKKHKDICRKISATAIASSNDQPKGASGMETPYKLNVVMTLESLSSSDLQTCCYCLRKSLGLMRCSRCEGVYYCDKQCQIKDFKFHRRTCRRIKHFLEARRKIHPSVWKRIRDRDQQLESDFDLIGDETCADYDFAILVEILEPMFLPYRVGVYVQDESGERMPLIFYTEEDEYHPPPNSGTSRHSIPLSECCQQGNFIILLEPQFHVFVDGSTGFRIDEIWTIQFVFMDQNK